MIITNPVVVKHHNPTNSQRKIRV